MDTLDEIRADLASITQWPWAVGNSYGGVVNPRGATPCSCDHRGGKTCTESYGGQLVGESFQRRDSAFVAKAPERIESLLDMVDGLKALVMDASTEALVDAALAWDESRLDPGATMDLSAAVDSFRAAHRRPVPVRCQHCGLTITRNENDMPPMWRHYGGGIACALKAAPREEDPF